MYGGFSMKRSVWSLAAIILGMLLSSCQGGGTKADTRNTSSPDWALNPPKSGDYYYFVGFVEGIDAVEVLQDNAVNNAKAEAMKYIFEETTVTSVFETYGSLSGSEELQKDMRETMISKSAARLSGVETEKTEAKPFNDDGLQGHKVWVLVKIKKSTVESERKRIISEIQRKLEMVEKNIREAKAALADGRILDAVRAYLTAAVSATQVEERADEFPIYISEMGKILANLFIEARDIPESVDLSGGSELTYQVLYAGNDGKMPVKGANIKFVIRDNKGDYDKNSVSGKDGLVKSRISKLDEVNTSTKMYASLYLPMDELLNLPEPFKKYHSTVSSYIDRVNVSSSFKVISGANLNIPTAVIAISENAGEFRKVPNLSSEALSYLQSKGYKTRKFPDDISLKNVYELKDSVLQQLSSQGIKRVFVLYVNADIEATYKESLKKWVAFYSLSSQLVDTATGDILASKNIKLSGTSDDKRGTFDSFIKASGKQLKKLID